VGSGFSCISKTGLKTPWKKAHGESVLWLSPSVLHRVRVLWSWSVGKQQPHRETLWKAQVAFLLGGGGGKGEGKES